MGVIPQAEPFGPDNVPEIYLAVPANTPEGYMLRALNLPTQDRLEIFENIGDQALGRNVSGLVFDIHGLEDKLNIAFEDGPTGFTNFNRIMSALHTVEQQYAPGTAIASTEIDGFSATLAGIDRFKEPGQPQNLLQTVDFNDAFNALKL